MITTVGVRIPSLPSARGGTVNHALMARASPRQPGNETRERGDSRDHGIGAERRWNRSPFEKGRRGVVACHLPRRCIADLRPSKQRRNRGRVSAPGFLEDR